MRRSRALSEAAERRMRIWWGPGVGTGRVVWVRAMRLGCVEVVVEGGGIVQARLVDILGEDRGGLLEVERLGWRG